MRWIPTLLLLAGCALLNGRKSDPDPADGARQAARDALMERHKPGGVGRAYAALEAVLELDPGDMEAAGWLARLEWTLAEAARAGLPEDDFPARAHYLNGVERAVGCLQSNSGFNAAFAADRGRLTPFNLATLPPEALPCLIWATANVLDLAELRGPGASLSLVDLPLLLARAKILNGDQPDAWLLWLNGRLVLGLEPPDTDAGYQMLSKASRLEPGFLRFTADLIWAFPGAGDGLPPLDPDPNPWENRLVRARFAAPTP
ncbi:MAG TPA: hypothetical protein PLA94_04705 [Myxococcota bacterium]|nr:hypothetical protein [Myxococcota bacterium]